MATAGVRESEVALSGGVAPGAPGLEFPRVFSRAEIDPFDEIEWELRSAVIANEKGEKVFEQRDVEIPKFWSQQATNIVVSKYFRGQMNSSEREHSVRQLIGRVVDTITGWADRQDYFATPEDLQAFSGDLKYLLLHQKAAFNSPVWFNCGFEQAPQCSACFINSVDDTMDSILTLARTEGMLFKFGSGTGTNLSPIRSSRELLAGGGTASGPVSFMKGYDAFAGVIKSGGKTRRAAKMVILNADHPDIVDFINCKVDEERKAWALIDAGYDGSFTGTAYSSVFFQNSNNSIRVPDEFMRAVVDDGEWQTRAVTEDRRVMDTLQGARSDASSGRGHARLRRSGDAVRHDDQRLAHLPEHRPDQRVEPLLRVHVPGRFGLQPGVAEPDAVRPNEDEVGRVRQSRRSVAAVRTLITAMEIIVGNASYPTEAIGKNSDAYRPLGLGYANLGALLMSRGVPYDSDEGRDYAAALTALMTGEAYAQSARIARDCGGPFSRLCRRTSSRSCV